MLAVVVVVSAFAAAAGARSDDAFTMNTFRCEPGGWRVTTPAGWVLTQKPSEDPRASVEVNATKTGTKGNIVVAWHKGMTLAALKKQIDDETRAAGAHVKKRAALSKKGHPEALHAEYDVDYGGVRGRTYVVAVAGPLAVVEVTVPGAGPAADYDELKAAADAFAAAVVFEAPGEKPWAHKKNVENLKGTLCSSKTASLAFDGAGHLVVEPGAARTWYELVGDDAKVAIPGKAGGPAIPIEIACTATDRTDAGLVRELLCGKTKWRADLCGAP